MKKIRQANVLAASDFGFTFLDSGEFRFGWFVCRDVYRRDRNRTAGNFNFQPVAGGDTGLTLNLAW
jgi:hypothetical protein